MANRKFFRGTAFCSLERELCFLYGSAVIGAAGAVGTVKGLGIKSVTKVTGDGKYEIELEDAYMRLMSGNVGFVSTAGSGVARVEILATPSTFQADFKNTKTVTIQCFDYAGAAVNPASGSVLSFDVVARNSSEGPGDI